MNRIQFQKGLSLNEFTAQFGSEAQCQSALFAWRWPEGFRCPACGSESHRTFERQHHRFWECADCGRQTTVTAGTVMAHSKLPLRTWFQAIYLITQAKNQVSALELMRHLGVSYPTAWLIQHKLLRAMAASEAGRLLGHRVEIDDAYLGGELTGAKVGRGSPNKVPFVAAVETIHGRPIAVRFDPVADFTLATLSAWAKKTLRPGAHVVSDGLKSFAAVQAAGCTHEPTVAGPGKKGAQHPSFKWVNTLLGNLKTSLAGTYHAFGFRKYADRYLAAAAWRFNRRTDMAAMVTDLATTLMRVTPCGARELVHHA